MSADAATGAGHRDPFGATPGERVVRRLAGAGVATAALAGVLWWVPPAALLVAGATYLVGAPLSLLLEHRWPSGARRAPVRRYLVAGAILGGVVPVVLFGAPTGGRDDGLTWLVVLTIAAVAGAVAGGLAAWSGARLPAPSLVPVAAVGLVVAVGVLPAEALWQTHRAAYDEVVLEPTGEAFAAVGDAEGLAAAVAAGFDRAADRGEPRLAQRTWTAVAEDLADDLGDDRVETRFRLDDDLPHRRLTRERVRPITTALGDLDRACVMVRRDGVDVHGAACREVGGTY